MKIMDSLKNVSSCAIILLSLSTVFLGINNYIGRQNESELNKNIKILQQSIEDKNIELEDKYIEIDKLNSLNETLERDITSLFNENQQLKQGFENVNDIAIEDIFRVTCSLYNVDYKLVFAIAKLETGNFTSELYKTQNNVGGLKTKDGSRYQSFSTVSEGVVEMVRNIKNNYIDCGLTTPEAMNSKYCPTDGNWSVQVRKIMDNL